MSNEVEVHLAFVFDCDNEDCCKENFIRPAVMEHDEDTDDELRTEYNLEPDETGVWLTVPTKVTCKFCGHEFKVANEST
jgi:hypothetical protein